LRTAHEPPLSVKWNLVLCYHISIERHDHVGYRRIE
jgi:hypothetical protein